MESIEKLRESSHLDDGKWTLETGEVIHVYGSEPNDPNAVNWGEQWRKIADEIEAEIESRYMELPVDADGVPIRIGDSLECTEYGNQTERFTVYGYTTEYLTWTGEVTPLMATNENSTEFYCRNCRHFNPRTIEDVLRDLANEVWEASITCQTTWSDSGLDGIEKRYAAEIRELMEVDE